MNPITQQPTNPTTMDKPKIIVIGSSNTDLIVKSPRIPSPGETILGGEYSSVQGGKGANQAVAVARAGGNVTFVARVGKDELGEKAIEAYKKDGIHTDHIIIDEDDPTGVALINISADGENSISVASGANANLSPHDIEKLEAVIAKHDLILLQLEIPKESVEKAIDIAHKHGVKIILNPAPAASISTDALSKVDVITPNETETALITGTEIKTDQEIINAASSIKNFGVNSVVITLGSRGVYFQNHLAKGFVCGLKAKAIDTTAAGDTFNGYLAVGLASRLKLQDVINLGNAAASLSVRKFGAQTSIPFMQDTKELLPENLRDRY